VGPVLSIALCLAGSLVADVHGWELASEKKGLTVEHRKARETAYHEVRISGASPAPPAVIAAQIWDHRRYEQFLPWVKQLEVLQDAENERVCYQRIHTTLVADRDYSVRFKKLVDKETQLHQIFFATANDLGPPPKDRLVRVTILRGSWTIEPADGGSFVTYQILTDPGGSIPAWIGDGPQRDALVDFVRIILERAAKAR
jgi:ribosome-associated toxin RatA of RatAB toxin-antitoxin module